MILHILADGTEKEFTYRGKKPSLKELQNAVGGYIEIVHLDGQGKDMVCNEEGKLMDLPYNPKATDLWRKSYGDTDLIVGNVLIADEGEIE